MAIINVSLSTKSLNNPFFQNKSYKLHQTFSPYRKILHELEFCLSWYKQTQRLVVSISHQLHLVLIVICGHTFESHDCDISYRFFCSCSQENIHVLTVACWKHYFLKVYGKKIKMYQRRETRSNTVNWMFWILELHTLNIWQPAVRSQMSQLVWTQFVKQSLLETLWQL